ncbi:MAG TPA: prepilin-type N-terminal cleavage/methylation domain-containing protein [Gemmataceae bacterium]|nr:prepilin-type N-terminal cleavage/methylation domain-containing protein [Gemmataceae bacterium]
MHRPSRHGFTLIELSIVLVIIGLIIGGVLVGRELIHVAAVRAQITQIGEINTAVNESQTKYSCLSGDCYNATAFFANVTNGNGDGRIAGYCTSDGATPSEVPYLNGFYCQLWGVQAPEWFHAYDHLAAAGLVKLPRYDETDATNNHGGGAYYQQALRAGNYKPSAHVYAGQAGVVFGYEPGGHRIRLGACTLADWGVQVVVFGCAPPPSDLLSIDAKLDDGSLTTGRAFITDQIYLYDYEVGGYDERGYCTGGGLATDDGECAWSIKADF